MVNLAMRRNAQSVTSDFEKQFYRGTSPDAVDAICNSENFDLRMCGKSSGSMYGQESYFFATNASYSHSYAISGSDGFQFIMFLVRVLVGSFIKGEPEYRRPPNKDPSNPSSDQYDSCVDNERNHEIFVYFFLSRIHYQILYIGQRPNLFNTT